MNHDAFISCPKAAVGAQRRATAVRPSMVNRPNSYAISPVLKRMPTYFLEPGSREVQPAFIAGCQRFFDGHLLSRHENVPPKPIDPARQLPLEAPHSTLGIRKSKWVPADGEIRLALIEGTVCTF